MRFGAVKSDDPINLRDYYEKWKKGEVSIRGAAAEMGVSYSLFYRRCLEMEKEEDCFLK